MVIEEPTPIAIGAEATPVVEAAPAIEETPATEETPEAPAADEDNAEKGE